MCAEVIWALGEGYDIDVIITRHADNVAEMISEMNEALGEKSVDTP